MSELLYTSSATTYGGLEGKVQSTDGVINMATALPGSQRDEQLNDVTNPEQLFAAAYATCFDSALQLVANKENIDFESQVTTNVSLLEDEANEGYYLEVNLQIKGNLEKGQLDSLVQKANQIWPYSDEKRAKMKFSLEVDTLSN